MPVKPSAQNNSPSKPTSKSVPVDSDSLVIGDAIYHLADHTPMMVQYLNMKVNYPQALLLYRMGDFYELFFEDAKRAAQILDITLTRRGTDKAGNTIAMAGVPFHAADSYMARLIAAGQTVVVCEQIDESATGTDNANNPSNAPTMGDKQKKDKSKSTAGTIMRREVVKTLTAGTITDDALIAPNHTPTVVAIDIETPKSNSKQPVQAAVSQMDLAAGTLTTQTISANQDDIESLQTQMLTVLARFAPSECIISEALSDSNGDISEEWLLWLRQHLNCPIIEVAANDFHREHASATLCQQFEVQRLDGLGISGAPLAQSSCAALIHYARQTQQRHVPQLNQLIVEYNDDYLIIDANSQQNLELFTPVSSNGTSLISVLNHCQTPMGRRLLVQQMKRPLRQHSRINLRLDAITSLLDTDKQSEQCSGNISLVTSLRETLNAIGDIERISSRIGLMSAKPRDLRKLADGIASSAQLTTLLTNAGISHEQAGLLPMLMQQLPAQLPAVQSVAELIERAIIVEPPAHIRDGGMLAAGYDAEFDRLTHLHDNIQVTLDEMVERARQESQLPSLKVGFNKVSGFYFELPKMQAKNAPAHFIRRQTLKSSERFITNELKTVETEYLSAQSLALTREKQLYNELLIRLGSHLAELQQLSAAIAQIDVLNNWAQLAITYNWQRPVMSNESKKSSILDNSLENSHSENGLNNNSQTSINIKEGRHVVVEAVLNPIHTHQNNPAKHSSHFVANDCVLGSYENPERLLMITGPNMGGKSTYMRQTALIVLLAHCGSFVPAARAHIGDIDRIFTRIGSADDLAGGKSTFMVEMIETANILNQATNKSLVLMDEVGRGTATTDGLAIAHACVNRLVEIGCLTLFATHYFELTKLAQNPKESSGSNDKFIRNVHVAASEIDGQLLLLHQIKDGAASSSFGLHVAKMAGIPIQVLNDAKRYLVDNLSIDNLKPDNESIDDDKNELAKSVKDKRQQTYDSNIEKSNIRNLDKKQKNIDIPQQNQLFSLQDELQAIDPDSLTPKQAHDLLYHLKEIISY
ncbi:DNA mismatch repair protein MutS [Psychrobacter cryohalolentis]|uniref:DNA mismatch repair protein MutS n=1 Tax=Psychrobacter cryohalolentis (strain ATCC BAA-1226 / DSM 17306 / VKM B-2378 / K5) TaxID=335284 RepID=MUTS_PSYCK|nr:DNA mismatch repair protein MutS [Psychrobacter cryohalolentis]Q1QE46.1 RecName: Full=DNA mismatch repair protein MutS [Psychrobacter cryohalolentis K5]ABE74057.1 DNA mismatch repair protein MutS [Psychrobacter cryohalolentis K5]ASE26691.1 DNA mismatch repair protein MutS [Psychrobacter cryohalolentis]